MRYLSSNENVSIPTEIKSGIVLKKVYNVEKVSVDNTSYTKKVKRKESQILDKKYHKKHLTIPREKRKKKHLKKNQDKHSNAEKRTRAKSSNSQKRERKHSPDKDKRSSDQKKNLEHRLSNKIWQIISHDLFRLNNDKYNIQSTDSETKNYIISVIKKYNTRELKNFNRPRETQTSTEILTPSSSSGSRKMAIKRRVRKQLWHWAKIAIKNNEHWSTFLADNDIVVENINIDKFDLGLIDLDKLGIENKLLKRSIIWLFK